MPKETIGFNDSNSHTSRKKRMSRKKRKKKMIIAFSLLIIIFLGFLFARARMAEQKAKENTAQIGTIHSVDADKKQKDEDGQDIVTYHKIKVFAFNVGDCNAILIDDGSFEILIDGGCNGKKLVKLISPYIDSSLDYVINTNYMNESTNGLKEVYNSFKVDNTIIANTPEIADYDKNYDGFFSFLKAAKKKSGITHMDIIKTAKTINLSSGAALTVTPNSDEGEDIWDQTAFCVLSYQNNEVWFTNGMGKNLFKTLMPDDSYNYGSVSALFAPRHGDLEALDVATIKALSPQNIIIQGTNPKKHGLLTRKGAEKYKDISYSTYATYRGTVIITLGGENKDAEINDNTNISQN